MNVLLLLGQLLLLPDRPAFTWAARQFGPDAVVIVAFADGGTNERICVRMHEQTTHMIVDEHCWVPRSAVADIDEWKEWDYGSGRYFISAWLRQRLPGGDARDLYAYPLPDQADTGWGKTTTDANRSGEDVEPR